MAVAADSAEGGSGRVGEGVTAAPRLTGMPDAFFAAAEEIAAILLRELAVLLATRPKGWRLVGACCCCCGCGCGFCCCCALSRCCAADAALPHAVPVGRPAARPVERNAAVGIALASGLPRSHSV